MPQVYGCICNWKKCREYHESFKIHDNHAWKGGLIRVEYNPDNPGNCNLWKAACGYLKPSQEVKDDLMEKFDRNKTATKTTGTQQSRVRFRLALHHFPVEVLSLPGHLTSPIDIGLARTLKCYSGRNIEECNLLRFDKDGKSKAWKKAHPGHFIVRAPVNTTVQVDEEYTRLQLAGPGESSGSAQKAQLLHSNAAEEIEYPKCTRKRSTASIKTQTGKTKFENINGYSCLCNEVCSKTMLRRHLAIDHGQCDVIDKYINVPPMPVEQDTDDQKSTAQFVEMIYKTLDVPLTGSDKRKWISMIHWPDKQRRPMFDSLSAPSKGKGLILQKNHRSLIRQLLKEGNLSNEDISEGGHYFNKPTMSSAEMEEELMELEIRHWAKEGSLIQNAVKNNSTIRPTRPAERGTTLTEIQTAKIKAIESGQTASSNNPSSDGLFTLPYCIRNAKAGNRLKHMKRRGKEVPLNMNDLASALIPMHAFGNKPHVKPAGSSRPAPLLRGSRSNKSEAPQERDFVDIDGFENCLDKWGNPCYWNREEKQGYWLVRHYLLEEDIEVVLEFAKEHKLEDLCIYLSVLCRFVSELPEAKDDWDESFKHPGSRMGRFEDRIKLSDEFLSNLIHVTAECIHGSSDFEHLKRVLWETWPFFNPALDCVYSPRMKAHRRTQRSIALQDIPEEKQMEHLEFLDRLHKFLIILWTQQSTDEMSEQLYYKICQGFHSTKSFLQPLQDLSYIEVMLTMNEVFKKSSLQGIKAESLLEFCLISHLLYDGSFPLNFECLAFRQVKCKKLSIALVIAGGECGAVPVDSHVKTYFESFSHQDEDKSECVKALRLESSPSIARYINDFVAEFGQIFHRGPDASVTFAVQVLEKVGKRDSRYSTVIAKWMARYKNRNSCKKIAQQLNELGFEIKLE